MKHQIRLKEINRLALPAVVSGIAEPVLSITDTAIVGNMDFHATESLAAVGIAGSFLSALIWTLGQTRSAISSIISQYLGAGKLAEIKSLPAQAISIIFILSLLVAGISFFIAESIFVLYNAKGLILSYCMSYFQIRIFGFPLMLFTYTVFGVFRGLQNTFWPMMITITGAAVNIIMDYILVYGIEGYLPPLYIKGAAYASLIAQSIMALMAYGLLVRKTTASLRLTFPINKEIPRMLYMSWNLFVRTIALNLALYLCNAYATKYGKEYIAAQTIAINIWFFSAFFIDGFSSAGNILSGKLIGAGNIPGLRQLAKQLVVYSIITASILALFMGIFHGPLGSSFTDDPMVLMRFYSILPFVILAQPINAVAFIFDGIFKGLGEMKYLRNVLLLATFVGFVPCLLFFDFFNWKLKGIWAAFTIWMLLRALALLVRFAKHYRLKNKSLILKSKFGEL